MVNFASSNCPLRWSNNKLECKSGSSAAKCFSMLPSSSHRLVAIFSSSCSHFRIVLMLITTPKSVDEECRQRLRCSGLLWAALVCSPLVWSVVSLVAAAVVYSGLTSSGLLSVRSGVVWPALVWPHLRQAHPRPTPLRPFEEGEVYPPAPGLCPKQYKRYERYVHADRTDPSGGG